MNAPVFKSIPLNEHGRDFVIGDIHGAYDMVIDGMKQVNFDPKSDRIFSVGDLIDRGPQSHRALGFLAKYYVHAVRGNHDHDFSTLTLDEIKALGEANWNGMAWVLTTSAEKLQAMQAKFAQLPIAMQIETRRGTVGLVHGDVPTGMRWQAFLYALERGDESVTKIALTGRNRIKTQDATGVAGIDRMFVGHTIQWGGPKRLANVCAIDTGAVFRELNNDNDRGSLTMINMACHTGVIAPAPDLATRHHILTECEEAAGPFGKYAKSA